MNPHSISLRQEAVRPDDPRPAPVPGPTPPDLPGPGPTNPVPPPPPLPRNASCAPTGFCEGASSLPIGFIRGMWSAADFTMEHRHRQNRAPQIQVHSRSPRNTASALMRSALPVNGGVRSQPSSDVMTSAAPAICCACDEHVCSAASGHLLVTTPASEVRGRRASQGVGEHGDAQRVTM
jgi:hypothetical protein